MFQINYMQSTSGSRPDGNPTACHDPRLRRSVFVGDLSFFCTEIDLANVFSRFGHVETVEIKRGRHGDSLLHGFVEFDCDASAELAIKHMNGRKWMGRKLRVNWTNISVANNPEESSWIQVHVNFTCKDLARKINEEFLEAIFVPFGGLADVTIKRHGCTGHPLQTTGYGFAYFKETFCALRAVHALRVIMVDGVRMECSLSRKAEASISQSMGVAPKIPIAQASKPPSPTFVGFPGSFLPNEAVKSVPSHPPAFVGGKVSPSTADSNHVFRTQHLQYQQPYQALATSNRERVSIFQQQQAQPLSQPLKQIPSSGLYHSNTNHYHPSLENSDFLFSGKSFSAKDSSSDDATDSEFSGSTGLPSIGFETETDLPASSFRYHSQVDQLFVPQPNYSSYSLF